MALRATAWGDADYQGVEKHSRRTGTAVSSGVWRLKPGRRRLLGEGVAEEAAEKRKDRCGRRLSIRSCT